MLIDFDCFAIEDEPPPFASSEDDLKEWIWATHKERIVAAMKVLPNKHVHDSELHKTKRKLALLDVIGNVQKQQCESPEFVYIGLLQGLLEVMGCDYGIIGEIQTDPSGKQILRTLAITPDTPMESSCLRLQSLSPFISKVMTKTFPLYCGSSREIVNDDSVDLCVLNSFLVMPLYQPGAIINGIVTIGSRQRGHFTARDATFLEPFLTTCSSLILANHKFQESNNFIDKVKDKVQMQTSELAKANVRLEEAKANYDRASVSQLEQFACLSHEIRTPLNCITGLLGLLRDSPLNATQQESVNMILNSCDMLRRVVDDGLDYVKIDEQDNVTVSRSSLQEALSSTLQAVEESAWSKSVRITTYFDSSVPEFVQIDSLQLKQTLQHLLSSSIKSSSVGGLVELKVRVLPTGNMEGHSQQVLRFSVKDFGQGISEADCTKMFEPLLQASAQTDRVRSGKGLGLLKAAKSVKAMGGSMSVESQGASAEFTVDLPGADSLVDMADTVKQLCHTTVYLIWGNQRKAQVIGSLFDEYQVNFQHLDSTAAFRASVDPGQLDVEFDKIYVCLIHENNLDDATRQLLGSLPRVIMITFGKTYQNSGSVHHFRALTQTLPCVLVRTLANCVEDLNRTLAASQAKAPNEDSIRNMRVLLAEDNAINQKVLARILARLGIENVDIVENGCRAVDQEASTPYDIVLMDMQMPIMGGVEACRLINHRSFISSHPRATVVFVTAHVSDSFEEECMQAGGYAFLPKPVSIREIEMCLERVRQTRQFKLRENHQRGFTMVEEDSPIQVVG